MNILKMTPQTKDDIKAGLIGALFVVLIIVVLTGCTWTFHRSPMKLHIVSLYGIVDFKLTFPFPTKFSI